MTANWVVFLRGVNVGGHGKLPMAALRKHLTDAGAEAVATYIQSGNIICKHPANDAAEMAQWIVDRIAEGFGFAPKALALPPQHLAALIAEIDAPNGVAAKNIYVYLTDRVVSEDALSSLTRYCTNGERFQYLPSAQPGVLCSALAVVAPNGIGGSKLAAPLERLLQGEATARNLNSLHRVQALTEG